MLCFTCTLTRAAWCGLYFSFLKPQTTFSSGNGSFKHATCMHWQTSCAFIWVVCIRLGKEVCITCIYAGVGIHYYMLGIFIWIHLLSNDCWLVHDNIKQTSVIYLCFIVDCCTSSLFISPEPKAQVNFSDRNLSVVRRPHRYCCRCKLFTLSFFSRTTMPISTKLDKKHHWVMGIQVYSNEGPHLFPEGDK